VLLVLGEGPDAIRFILEKFADKLGPMVRLLRELRLKQRLTDGLVKGARRSGRTLRVCLDSHGEPTWTPDPMDRRPRLRRGPLRDPSVGIRRMPGGRDRYLDPLPPRVDDLGFNQAG